MSRSPVLILVTGEPVAQAMPEHGTFADMIVRRARGAWPHGFILGDPRATDAVLPDPSELSGVVVTGSPASVTERSAWILEAEAYLRSVVRTRRPILGICFGHQLLATALGGEVAKNPQGREIGSVDVDVTHPHRWLGFSRGRANATHVDSVVRLPRGARSLARTEREPHAAIEFAEDVLGVQFHPEIDAPVMRHYIDARRDRIAQEGQDPEALRATVDDGADGGDVLVRFLADLAGREG